MKIHHLLLAVLLVYGTVVALPDARMVWSLGSAADGNASTPESEPVYPLQQTSLPANYELMLLDLAALSAAAELADASETGELAQQNAGGRPL